MALPVPNLDDRRFQDFVDDAKRMVQRRCPEWTDHNVSDPGVTLIEAFAAMADQVVYRLNRVPDLHYVKFLELIGVRLFPASAARVPVTFWLSAPRRDVVRVPAGTEVATRRAPEAEPVVFGTTADLEVVPVQLVGLRTVDVRGRGADHSQELGGGPWVRCFSELPETGETLLFGLTDAAPSCAVALRIDCHVDGFGIDPDRPPLVWEAWTADGWVACDVERDGTRALNRAGDVVLHLPADHTASVVAGLRAGWLRARVVDRADGAPRYTASPRLRDATAFTVGGTVGAVNARLVRHEVLGTAEGIPGGRFAVAATPVLPTDDPFVVEVSDDDEGWQSWTRVHSFADSGPDDRHVVLDPVAGTVEFGPCVRLQDGRLRQYGAVPARGATVRVREYRCGGGAGGNVSAHALEVLRSSIPYVSRVGNRVAARGGRDCETLDNARVRGPLELRGTHRAVTPEDYEQISLAAAPEVARVRCVPDEDGTVRVLLVPATGDGGSRRPFQDLQPDEETLDRVADALERRRVIGARVVVEPPTYRGLTVVAHLRSLPGYAPQAVRAAAVEALYRHHDPVHGGTDGRGWPFGRPVQYGEVYAVLQRVRGVDVVEDVRLFPADPVTGRRDEATRTLPIEPTALVFGYDHQVRVTPCED